MRERERESMCSIIRTKNCTMLPLAIGTSLKHNVMFPCAFEKKQIDQLEDYCSHIILPFATPMIKRWI